MPELPEVEVVVRQISKANILSKKIKKVAISEKAMKGSINKSNLQIDSKRVHSLKGHSFKEVQRRGKYILFNVEDSNTLLIHLGMSGTLRINTEGQQEGERHDHFTICFADGRVLRFNDSRRFGKICVVDHNEKHAILHKLGVEPLGREFNAGMLFQVTRQCRAAVKPFLMNGTIICGIGNIYASEILFAAGMDPTRRVCDLTMKECGTLVRKTKYILHHAIKKGGSTLKDFQDSAGKSGYFQYHFKVYGRGGKGCEKCTGTIESIPQCGRTTFYCDHCQK